MKLLKCCVVFSLILCFVLALNGCNNEKSHADASRTEPEIVSVTKSENVGISAIKEETLANGKTEEKPVNIKDSTVIFPTPDPTGHTDASVEREFAALKANSSVLNMDFEDWIKYGIYGTVPLVVTYIGSESVVQNRAQYTKLNVHIDYVYAAGLQDPSRSMVSEANRKAVAVSCASELSFAGEMDTSSLIPGNSYLVFTVGNVITAFDDTDFLSSKDSYSSNGIRLNLIGQKVRQADGSEKNVPLTYNVSDNGVIDFEKVDNIENSFYFGEFNKVFKRETASGPVLKEEMTVEEFSDFFNAAFLYCWSYQKIIRHEFLPVH